MKGILDDLQSTPLETCKSDRKLGLTRCSNEANHRPLLHRSIGIGKSGTTVQRMRHLWKSSDIETYFETMLQRLLQHRHQVPIVRCEGIVDLQQHGENTVM